MMEEVLRRRSVGAPAARSMLLTILGEYVLPRHPAPVWQEALIGALTTVGYTNQAARQATVRSARDGWLVRERVGRRSRLSLTEPTAALLRDGAERIYRFGGEVSWDGRWLLVVLRVPEELRHVRHQLTTRLAWAGFGSLGGGLWVSPHVDREGEARAVVAEVDDAVDALVFRAELGGMGEVEQVIDAAWSLPDLSRQFSQFIEDFGGVRATTPERAFVAQTTLVHAWRRFPFIDPNVPDELLPVRWPRSRAHALFHACHERWGAAAQAYFDELT